jgi:hypothetical protein
MPFPKKSLTKQPKPIRLVDAPPPIAPLDLWPALTNPKEHVAAQAGRYLAMYEGVMNYCMQIGDVALGRAMLLDLLRLTEVGRQKAELTMAAGEVDLSHLKEEDLLQLVNKSSETPA